MLQERVTFVARLSFEASLAHALRTHAGIWKMRTLASEPVLRSDQGVSNENKHACNDLETNSSN
jgi:hypothetical protein